MHEASLTSMKSDLFLHQLGGLEGKCMCNCFTNISQFFSQFFYLLEIILNPNKWRIAIGILGFVVDWDYNVKFRIERVNGLLMTY